MAMDILCCCVTNKHFEIKASYPKVLLLEQLRSSLPIEENLNQFWTYVFQAYKEFGWKIHVEKPEELIAEPIFCNEDIQVGKTFCFYRK